MANLLGDLWEDGEPNWAAACRFPDVKLHLYGKSEPRAGRKMGHLTATGKTVAGSAGPRRLCARRAAALESPVSGILYAFGSFELDSCGFCGEGAGLASRLAVAYALIGLTFDGLQTNRTTICVSPPRRSVGVRIGF